MEISTTTNKALAFAQRGMSGSVNAGAVSIESERAIAEARGQMQLAKMFPRDPFAIHDELMEACKHPALARVAFYALPRGGSTISGPSIRLAEEVARIYGNFQYGHRELSRGDGKSEIEVFAWDVERNNRSIRQITVEHTRDTKNGQIPLRDQKDIDDKIANVASKQVRGRILALLPKGMVEAAIEACHKTIEGGNGVPIQDRARKMLELFAALHVSKEMIESKLGHKMAGITPIDIVDLTAIYNSLREGAPVSDHFAPPAVDDESSSSEVAAIKMAAKSSIPTQPKAPVRRAGAAAVVQATSAEPEPAEPFPEQEQEPQPQSEDGGEVF